MVPLLIGCTTTGIMPLRDQQYNPFCCHPLSSGQHCPPGAQCEFDTYYGYGYICCGSINMVWDAYGGNYQKSSYDGCSKPRPRPPVQGYPSGYPIWPRSPGFNVIMESNDNDKMPPN